MGEFISAGVADGLEIEAPDFDFRLAAAGKPYNRGRDG
jgi:hypothetical protein